MAAIGYRPEIDGLRALAVGAVVMFHLGLGLQGGFVGVDVFFVISGFLITGIIRRGIENETFSLTGFWERRIRRIFPALFVVVAATLAVGYWMLIPIELQGLGRSSVAQSLLLANVYFWRDIGYFAGPAELKPLLHTWSLAVEEQFYLFFPLALCFLKRLSRKRLFALLAVVAAISFAGSVYGAMFHPGATFYLLPTRAWELLVGCMLVVLPWKCKPSPRRDNAIATLGFLALVLPIFLYNSKTPFPGLAAAPPVLGTAAIIFATASTPSIWLCRALSFRPLVFVGLISYSLYLWHWPAIAYTRIYFGHFSWMQMVFAGMVSFCGAIVSWKFVETPFRKNTLLKTRRGVFAAALTLSGSVVAVSIMFVVSDGCAYRFSGYSPELYTDITYAGSEYERRIPRTGPISLSDLPTLGKEPEKESRIDFVVWGDSHGLALSKCIDSIAKELKLTGKSVSASNRVVLPNAAQTLHKNFRDELKRKREILNIIDEIRPRNLVLIAFWGNLPNATLQSSSSESGTASIVKHELEEWVSFCSKRGIELYVVKQVPETKEPTAANSALRFALRITRSLSNQRGTLAEHEIQQAKIENIFQSLPEGGIHFVDPAPLMIDSEGLVINYHEGRALYRDTHHVTQWGAEFLRPVLKEMLQKFADDN